jgi:hypothetical protein
MLPTDEWVPTVPTTPEVDEKPQAEYPDEDDLIDHAAEREHWYGDHPPLLTDVRSGDLI